MTVALDLERNEEQELIRLRLDGYIRNLPGVIIGNLAAVVVTLAMLWGRVEPVPLVVWALLLTGLMGLRGYQLRYRERTQGWQLTALRAAVIGCSGATGLMWGLAAWLFMVPGSVELQAFLLFTIAVLNTGGAATLTPYYPAYLASLATCLPVAALRVLLIDTEFTLGVGLGLLIIAAILAFIGRRIGDAYVTAYRLQLRDRGLVEKFSQQALLLERSAQEAHLANRSRSEFLATVSHEIRTPVNAILGGIEILGATSLDNRQRQCVQVVEKAGQSLLGLLDNLLDITRMEAGRMVLEEVDFDLRQRLTDIVELMTPRAAEKGLTIGLDMGEDVPRFVRGDPARLRQIMLNLIGNAVKFTDRGAIAISAANLGPAPDGRVRVRFSVVDTGIGIAPDRMGAIFDAFSQADGSITRRFGGAGLGLSICRRLAEMMDGTITVSSEVGRGSSFHLECPLPVVERANAGVDGAAAPLPVWRRVPTLLLVEDEEINRFVAIQLLERQGFRIIAANDGHEALRLLAETPVDAILMDLGMPDMDGFETTARIRRMSGPAGRTPIIALTANVMPETIARCAQAGMQGFCSKPIRLPVLLRKLAEVVPPDGSAQGAGPSAEPARLETLRRDLGDQVAEGMLAGAQAALDDARKALADPVLRRSRRKVAELAHRLAGVLDVIGLEEEAATARRVEQAADSRGQDLDAPVAELADAVDRAVHALTSLPSVGTGNAADAVVAHTR